MLKKKILKNIFYLTSLILLTNNLSANTIDYNEPIDNNDICTNASIITPLNNITKDIIVNLKGNYTTNTFKGYSLQGKIYYDTDLYKFQVATDGTFTIEDNEIDKHYLYIGSSCGKDDIFNNQLKKVSKTTFKVKKGQILNFLYYDDSYDKTKVIPYTTKTTFKADIKLKPGETRTGYAGPTGIIGSNNSIIGTNIDKTKGNIYLIDDDKKDCPTAKYTNLDTAIKQLTSDGGDGTVVLCKGNYKAPSTTIKGMNNITLTSNYDTANGTTINGQLNFESINGLNISYLTINNANSKGISLDFTDNVNIHNVNINTSMESISAQHINKDFALKDSHLYSKNAVTVEINGASVSGGLISNVTIGNDTDNKVGKVGLSVGIDNILIDKVTVYSHEDGIQLRNSPGSTIKNSKIYTNTKEAIWVDNSKNVNIDNIYLSANSGNGVKITNSINTKIVNSFLESKQFAALNLSKSNNGLYQNNCFVTNNQVNDINIAEDMTTASFDNGLKGNYYVDADCKDNDSDNICDYKFNIVVNHNAIYTDNFPQSGCNYYATNQLTGPMFLTALEDINPADNIVSTTATIGTNTNIQGYTKNSLTNSTTNGNDKINLLIIADVSGSMYNADGQVTLADGTQTTKLKVTENAIKLLINKYSKIAKVKYDLIQFSTNIDADSGWTNNSITPVPNLKKGGSTSYYKALSRAMYTAIKNQPSSDKTIVYFMSDGDITRNSTDFYSSTFLNDWYKYIVLNPDIYKSYTYGILHAGSDLDAVSIPTDGYKTPDTIVLNTPEDILKELLKTLSSTIEYKLLNDYNGAFTIDSETGEVYVKDSSVFDIINDPTPKIIIQGKDVINNIVIQNDFLVTLKEGIDQGASSAVCDVFADAVQTRKNNSGNITWNGQSTIYNNPDTSLNTNTLNIPKTTTKSCDSSQCMASKTSGKIINIIYSNPPNPASAITKPTTSSTDAKIISYETNYNNSEYDNLIINSYINYKMKPSKTININYLKLRIKSKIDFTPTIKQNLNIGYITQNFYSYNTTISGSNLNNIKIKNYLLLNSYNNINLKADNSINIESFKVGTGGVIKLEAPVINIGNFEIKKTNNVITKIYLKADSINIDTLLLNKNVEIIIEPLNVKKALVRINNLNLANLSTMKLGDGFYYINNSLNIPKYIYKTKIEALNKTSEVDLYINNDLILGSKTIINIPNNTMEEYPASNFRIFVNGNFNAQQYTYINALIYAEKDIYINKNANIEGALSANSYIEIDKKVNIKYAPSLYTSDYGMCPTVTQPKPNVSFFEIWDENQPLNNRIVDTKIASKPFNLKISSFLTDINKKSNDKLEVYFWLKDDDTSTKLSNSIYLQKNMNEITTKTFQINGAYKNVHGIFQICSDYEKKTNKYQLYKFSDCKTTCQYELQETKNNPCIREVQTQEGFAVKPNKITISIKDKITDENLNNINNKSSGKIYKAGENFKIKITALDYNNKIITNYNEPFELETKKADNDMVSDGIIIPDLSTISNNKLAFQSGKLEFEANYNEVGIVNVKLKDNTTFASIDNINNLKSYIIKSENIKIGRFIPYSFSIVEVNLKDVIGNNNITKNCQYDYLNETGKNKTIYKYGITVEANNKFGEITTNYNNTFAKDDLVKFDVNWKNIGPNKATGKSKVSFFIPKNMWIDGVYSTPSGFEASADVDILKSIGVTRKTPFEPFSVDLTSENNLFTNNFQVEDSETTLTIDNAYPRLFDGVALLPNKLWYVYGRINPISSISTPAGDAKVKIYYEIYTKNNLNQLKNILGGINLNESVNDSYWYRNIKHQDCDIKTINDLTITFNPNTATIKNTDVSQKDMDILTIQDANDKRPINIIGNIDVSNVSYLLHSPYGNKQKIRFKVKFIDNIQKETNKASISNNFGKNTTNQRRFLR